MNLNRRIFSVKNGAFINLYLMCLLRWDMIQKDPAWCIRYPFNPSKFQWEYEHKVLKESFRCECANKNYREYKKNHDITMKNDNDEK